MALQSKSKLVEEAATQLKRDTQWQSLLDDDSFGRIGHRWLAANYDRCKHRVPLGQYPVEHRCLLRRFGQEHDSAYSFCDTPVLKDRQCIVYSFGVNDQISFEVEMASRTQCEVYMFDNHSVAVEFMVHGKSPTKDRIKPKTLPKNLHWYPAMLLNYTLPVTSVPLGNPTTHSAVRAAAMFSIC